MLFRSYTDRDGSVFIPGLWWFRMRRDIMRFLSGGTPTSSVNGYYKELAKKYRWKLAWFHLRLKYGKAKTFPVGVRGNGFTSHTVDLSSGGCIECIHNEKNDWFVTNLVSAQVKPHSPDFKPMPSPERQVEIAKEWAERTVEQHSRRYEFNPKTLTFRYPDMNADSPKAIAELATIKIDALISLLKRIYSKETKYD